MKSLTNRKVLLALLALIFLVSAIFFYFGQNEEVTLTHPVCPDDYPDTDAGSDMRVADTDVWTNTFFDNNPDATIDDWGEARREYWGENNCTLALERYEAAVSGEADTSDIQRMIDETVSE